MMANDYLASELAMQQEQQQLLQSATYPGGTHVVEGEYGYQAGAKEAAARALEPKHRARFTKAKQQPVKKRKASRRQAKAGRKAGR